MKKKLSLAQKIAAVTNEASIVARGGKNEEEEYRFARQGDIARVLKPLLHKYKLILTANDAALAHSSTVTRTETTRGSIVDLTVTWKLEDIETKEFRLFDIPGSGWGKDEKGTYKALTGSRKYAEVFIFDLFVSDEPEAPHDYPVDREEAATTAHELGRKKATELREELTENEKKKIAKRTAELKEQMASGQQA